MIVENTRKKTGNYARFNNRRPVLCGSTRGGSPGAAADLCGLYREIKSRGEINCKHSTKP